MRLRSHEISPFHVSMFPGTILVQVFFRQPWWWDFMGSASLAFLGDGLSQQTSWSSGSYSISAFLWGYDPWDNIFSVSHIDTLLIKTGGYNISLNSNSQWIICFSWNIQPQSLSSNCPLCVFLTPPTTFIFLHWYVLSAISRLRLNMKTVYRQWLDFLYMSF